MSDETAPAVPDEYPGLAQLARKTVERALEQLPPDVAITIFLVHPGTDGGLAYCSNVERRSMIGATVEWLRHQADQGGEAREDVVAEFKKWFGGGA